MPYFRHFIPEFVQNKGRNLFIPISKPDFKALAKTLFGKSCIYFVLVCFSPFEMEAADREGLQRVEAHTASQLSGRGPTDVDVASVPARNQKSDYDDDDD